MGLEVLTHTKRRDFKTCRRYFFHRHEQRLSLRSQKPGRRRGSAFGSALFAVQQHPPEPRSWEAVRAVVREAVTEFYAEVHPDTSLEARELEVEEAKVEVMATAYTMRYGVDDRREVTFDMPLRNPTTGRPSLTFRDGGKIDGCVMVAAKHVRIIEDKFVGSIQKAMIDRLPLDDQVTEYVDAFAQMGWRADVAYRHTRYPGINPEKVKVLKTKTKAAETIDEFRERLRMDVNERPDFYFDQQNLVFPLGHLVDFRQGRWQTAKDIMAARRQGFWYMSPQRCWEFGGCEFIPLCTKREGAQDLYVVVQDNPELDTGGEVTDEYAGS